MSAVTSVVAGDECCGVADEYNDDEDELPLLLEHVNLNIPNASLGEKFYVDLLGGQLNPVGTTPWQVHINLGASQLHCPFAALPSHGGQLFHVAQIWDGYIELLTTEELGVVRDRIESHKARVSEQTRGESQMCATVVDNGDTLLVSCPWGNTYKLNQVPLGHSVPAAHPGGSRSLVAMPRVLHWIAHGSAAPIAAFFTKVLGCPSQLNAAGGEFCCTIPFVTGQTLVFQEISSNIGDAELSGSHNVGKVSAESAETAPLVAGTVNNAMVPPSFVAIDAYDTGELRAYHLALYLGSDAGFERAFRKAEGAGLIYSNPRFEGGKPEFSNALTWEEARISRQFRVKNLCDPQRDPGSADSAGRLGMVLELEIRAPGHVSYPKKTRSP